MRDMARISERIINYLWIPGCVCKVAADVFGVLIAYGYHIGKTTHIYRYQIDYFWAVPLILAAAIAFNIWANSSTTRATWVCAVLLGNTLLCFCVGGVVGFWSNPWLVVAGWLWFFAGLICLLARLVRHLVSRRSAAAEPKNR